MSYESMDVALEILRGQSPELRNGAPNHAPMVVEALIALGREDAVQPWIDGNRVFLTDAPKSNGKLDVDWQEALGDFNRLGQWQNFFMQRIIESSWRDVVQQWLPRLIPGSMAAGTHGVIRCAHAARALEHGATELRKQELALALSYCAARYRTLSIAPRLSGSHDLESAVDQLPLLEPESDRSGSPPQIVMRLDGSRDFALAVQQLAPPAEVISELIALAEIGARLYLQNSERHPLVLLHCVTGPAALQLLVPYLLQEDQCSAFAYMWQAVAAWAAAFGQQGRTEFSLREVSSSWDDIIARAVASGDEHAIKFAEACRREETLHASPVFRAAALDWVERVFESCGWRPEERVSAGIRTRP